ncbi:MAG: hypothetical protein ACTSQI_20680 [Candidatus Helarchaeota archaeon]
MNLNTPVKRIVPVMLCIFILLPMIPLPFSNAQNVPFNAMELHYHVNAREAGTNTWYGIDYTVEYSSLGGSSFHVDQTASAYGQTKHYYWDVDANTRVISNAHGPMRATYHSFYFIPGWVKVGCVIPIDIGNDDAKN